MFTFLFTYLVFGIFAVMANCPHTIGVEFGTRIIEVAGQKIKLQIWDTGRTHRGVMNVLVCRRAI